MKLINLIIQIFHLRWSDKIFVNTFHEYHSFSSFINEVFRYCTIIDEVQRVYRKDAIFALYSTNVPSYIATYIALILKNVDFYLIPPTMSRNEVASIIMNSDVNILFTSIGVDEYKVLGLVSGVPSFKGMYNIENKKFKYLKLNKDKTDTEINNDELDRRIESITSKKHNPQDIEYIIFDYFNVKKRERNIGIFTSGTESTYPNVIFFDDDLIYNGLLQLIETTMLPVIKGKSVYTKISYSDAPIWLILWPLYEGSYFSYSMSESHVCIDNTHTFEQHWHYVSKEIYEMRFIGKFLLRSNLFWLFKFIAKYKLRKYFNFGTDKTALIVINAFLSPRILNTVIGTLPIYTTYGTQECNQLIAVNNFSTKEHKESNCVGEFFNNIQGAIEEVNLLDGDGVLLIACNHMTDDLSLVGNSVFYNTRDHASIKTTSDGKVLLYVYGKARYAIKNTISSGANYENLERILKSVPYFNDVLLLEINDSMHIFVYPNPRIIEANRFGLIDFKNFIKSYKVVLNNQYGNDFVKDVKIVFKDFLRTHNGKIKKALYFITLSDQSEEA